MEQKQKIASAVGDLRAWATSALAVELWLFLLLTVTVLGFCLRGPITELPSLFSGLEPDRIEQVEQDPYGVRQDSGEASIGGAEVRNNVETGF